MTLPNANLPILINESSFHSNDSLPLPNMPPRPRSSVNSRLKKELFEQKNEIGPKYIIFMVGLPARGKSYISKKLSRYLSWCGYNVKVFNVGNRRRLKTMDMKLKDLSLNQNTFTFEKSPSSPIIKASPGTTSHAASFFDPSNKEASQMRNQIAMETLDEIFSWLRMGGKVAIHDATNSTIERRSELLAKVAQEKNITAFFVESICTDDQILEKNLQMKLSGPDYYHMDPAQARNDFMKRIVNYEKAYETLSEEEEKRDVSFIKIINVGKKVIANGINGFLPSQCVLYLMQIHIKERTIWLTRHGESMYNLESRIGGDSPLTGLGYEYAMALTLFIKQRHPPCTPTSTLDDSPSNATTRTTPNTTYPTTQDATTQSTVNTSTSIENLSIWTSTLKRTMDTVQFFDPDEYHIEHIRTLNELYAGCCENMTYEDVERRYPEEFKARARNKLIYRYPGPGGESYADVIERLRPMIIELERIDTDLLVVTHQVVMRTFLSYFLGINLQEMTTMNVPLHTLFCLEPKPYGAQLTKCKPLSN